MKNKTVKRAIPLVVLLAFLMVFLCAPVTAGAVTVGVSSYPELQAALENPLVTSVVFNNDIAIVPGRKGININPYKPSLVVDGKGYTLFEAPSIDLNDTIRFNKATNMLLKRITWKNLNIIGQNHRGFNAVEAATAMSDVVITFDNIKYFGPQLIKASHSTVVIKDSDVLIMEGFKSCVYEIAEATHVRLEGDCNLVKNAPGNCREMFFIKGSGGGMTVASGANIKALNNYEAKHKGTGFISFSGCKNTYWIFEDDSKFEFRGNSYVHACNALDYVYVGKRAFVGMYTFGDFKSCYSMIHVNNKMLVEQDSVLRMIALENKQDQPNLQLRKNARIDFNSPNEVFIYNSSTHKCNSGLAMGPYGCDVDVYYNGIKSLEYWIYNTAPPDNLPTPTYDWRNPNNSAFNAYVNMKHKVAKDVDISGYYGAVPYNLITATLRDVNVIRINGGVPYMFTVKFNANGGAPTPPDQRVPFGEKVVQPQEPTRADYTFDGWFVDPNFAGNAWDFNVDVVTANITLNAKWVLIPRYNVNYHANGGNGAYSDLNVRSDQLYTVKDDFSAGISYTKHLFLRWNTQPDGSGVNYTPGRAIWLTGDLDLYAQWVELCTVTYDPGIGGTGGLVDVDLVMGSTYIIKSAAATGVNRNWYNLDSWNTELNGLMTNTGTAYYPTQTITITGDMILYAQWYREG